MVAVLVLVSFYVGVRFQVPPEPPCAKLAAAAKPRIGAPIIYRKKKLKRNRSNSTVRRRKEDLSSYVYYSITEYKVSFLDAVQRVQRETRRPGWREKLLPT